MTHPILRLRKPLALLALVFAYGIAGFMLIEHWPLFDAAFMTLLMITTIGFIGSHPLSPSGEIFTASLIVVGVGTMLYAFGVYAEMLSEGTLGTYQKQRALASRRRSLHDHFIICGYGRMGTQVVRELDEDGVPCAVIDNNPEAVARLEAEKRLFVDGDAASEEVLRQAGIERARGLISTVDSDERAVYITLAARALNPRLFILSRAGRPESVRRIELAGADRVISPYRMAGRQLALMAIRPALVDVMETLHHGDASIGVEEVLVRTGAVATGRTLEDLQLLTGQVARLLAVRRRDGQLFVDPVRELIIQEGDLVVALGTREQLEATAAVLQ